MVGASLAGGASIGLHGCSFLVDTGGLRGGTEAERPDRQPPSDDGGGSGPPDSASADVDGGTNRPPFCETQTSLPFLCEDFDKPTIDPRWSVNGGVIFDERMARSGTRALLSATTSVEERPYLLLRFDPVRRVRLSFSVLEESASQCGGANIGAISLVKGDAFYTVQVQRTENGSLHLQEYGEPGGGQAPYASDVLIIPSPPRDSWQRIQLDANLVDTRSATVTVNDAATPVVTNWPLRPLSDIDFMSADIGIVYVVQDSGPCRFRYDDIVVEHLK